uniref:Transporter n=1 Tax=Plectus sambesii TaxID=2011161 RepID=A0A914WCA1_9BILA
MNDSASGEVTDWRLVLRRQLVLMVERNAEHSSWAETNNDDVVLSRTSDMSRLQDEFRRLLIESPTAALEMQSDIIKLQNETDDIIKRHIQADQRRKSGTKIELLTPAAIATNMESASVARSSMSLLTSASSSGSYDPSAVGAASILNNEFPISLEREEREKSLNSYRTSNIMKIVNLFTFRQQWLNRLIQGKQGNDKEYRDLWSTQVGFFLSCLGFMVGVGNIWRFPSKVYLHGGGAFLIPYFVCLIGLGLPIVYLHLCLGQYSGLSASGVFTKMMPLASGIGWTLVVGAVPLCIYYNMTVAWGLYYFWYSLSGFLVPDGTLPWATCEPEWVAKHNCCDLRGNKSCFENKLSMTSTEAFFHFQVLHRTPVINVTTDIFNHTETVTHAELGPLQGQIVLALAVAWILTFFCVSNGIGSIGWAVYFTTTVPYLLLIILLFRGLSLDGASDGVHFFWKPDLEQIWRSEVWTSAAEQAFYSLGIDAGPLITMASYSRFRNNIYRDAWLLVAINTMTSLLCGTVLFSFVGFLAHEQGKNINELLRHDSLYLAFTAYPAVTSYMEFGPLWAAVFFGMVVLSAIDAEFAWIEMIAASFMEKAGARGSKFERKIIIALCIFSFICGLPFCTRGGIYIFHSIENFSGNWGAFTLTLGEIIVVSYVYGVDNFMKDVSRMQHPISVNTQLVEPSQPMSPIIWLRGLKNFFGSTGSYIKWSWLLFSPLILVCLLVASVSSYQRVKFSDHTLPFGYELTAWILMIGPLVIIPSAAIYFYQYAKSSGKPITWLYDSTEWRNIKTPEVLSEYNIKAVTEHRNVPRAAIANEEDSSTDDSSFEEDEADPPTWHSSLHSAASFKPSLRLRSISGYTSSAGDVSSIHQSELPILSPLQSNRSLASSNHTSDSRNLNNFNANFNNRAIPKFYNNLSFVDSSNSNFSSTSNASVSGNTNSRRNSRQSGNSGILRPAAIRPYTRNPRSLSRPSAIFSLSTSSAVGRRIAVSNNNSINSNSPINTGSNSIGSISGNSISSILHNISNKSQTLTVPTWQEAPSSRLSTPPSATNASSSHSLPSPLSLFGAPPQGALPQGALSSESVLLKARQRSTPDGSPNAPELRQAGAANAVLLTSAFGQPPPMLNGLRDAGANNKNQSPHQPEVSVLFDNQSEENDTEESSGRDGEGQDDEVPQVFQNSDDSELSEKVTKSLDSD